LIKYISSTPTRSIENVGKLENIDGNIMELPSWRHVWTYSCWVVILVMWGLNGALMGTQWAGEIVSKLPDFSGWPMITLW
jgi:hypothetical protein